MLSPYKVLDMTQGACSLSGKIFADLGANVIKIESPNGDISRFRGPFIKDKPHIDNSYEWHYLNANKRGITLDLEKTTDQEIFKKLTEIKDHTILSLTKLMQIYEYTCEWNKALSTVEKLNNINPSNEYRQNIPHYFCQISEKYISDNNLEKAELYINKAKSTNSKSSRILFVSIQIALKKGKLTDALKIYKKLCVISDLGHQILLPDLIKSAKEKGQSEKVTQMMQEVYNNPSVAKDHLALLAIMQLNVQEKVVMQSFYEFLANDIYFSELLKFNNMNSITELMNNELINNIREKLNRKSKNQFKYLCKNCGYKTIKLSWQCPTCRSWESSDPINFITNNI